MMPRKRTLYRFYLVLIILLSFFFSTTKGWGIFLTVPAFVISTPMLIVCQVQFMKKLPLANWRSFEKVMFLSQPLFYFAFFLCVVAVDDSSRGYVFGIFRADNSGWITDLSAWTAILSGYAAIGTMLVTPIAIARIKSHRR